MCSSDLTFQTLAWLFFVAFTTSVLVSADDTSDSSFTLTILHVNDIHSRAEEDVFKVKATDLPAIIADEITAAGDEDSAVDEIKIAYGGYPRLVTLFDDLESAASDSDAVLRLHAGDMISGSIYYT